MFDDNISVISMAKSIALEAQLQLPQVAEDRAEDDLEDEFGVYVRAGRQAVSAATSYRSNKSKQRPKA